MLKRWGAKHCFYCGIEVVYRHWPPGYTAHSNDATRDHRIPLSRGGLGGGNIVTSCRWCNNAKGSKSAQEFQGRVSTW